MERTVFIFNVLKMEAAVFFEQCLLAEVHGVEIQNTAILILEIRSKNEVHVLVTTILNPSCAVQCRGLMSQVHSRITQLRLQESHLLTGS
jgi:hypothetical protein